MYCCGCVLTADTELRMKSPNEISWKAPRRPRATPLSWNASIKHKFSPSWTKLDEKCIHIKHARGGLALFCCALPVAQPLFPLCYYISSWAKPRASFMQYSTFLQKIWRLFAHYILTGCLIQMSLIAANSQLVDSLAILFLLLHTDYNNFYIVKPPDKSWIEWWNSHLTVSRSLFSFFQGRLDSHW